MKRTVLVGILTFCVICLNAQNSKDYRNNGFESALAPHVPKDPPREDAPEVLEMMYPYMSKDPSVNGGYIFDFAAAMNDGIPERTIEANIWVYAKIHENDDAPPIEVWMMDAEEYASIRYYQLGGGNIPKKKQRTLPNGSAVYDANGEPVVDDNPDYLGLVNQIESEYNDILAKFYDFKKRKTINTWEDWKGYMEGDAWGVRKLNPNLRGNQ